MTEYRGMIQNYLSIRRMGRMGWMDTYGVWDGPVYTAIFKMDKQQRRIV